MEGVSKQLYDTVLQKEVPEDVYQLDPKENTKAVAKALKDWEDVKEGEYWYPNHCILTPRIQDEDSN